MNLTLLWILYKCLPSFSQGIPSRHIEPCCSAFQCQLRLCYINGWTALSVHRVCDDTRLLVSEIEGEWWGPCQLNGLPTIIISGPQSRNSWTVKESCTQRARFQFRAECILMLIHSSLMLYVIIM